jgi:hypothetical protein
MIFEGHRSITYYDKMSSIEAFFRKDSWVTIRDIKIKIECPTKKASRKKGGKFISHESSEKCNSELIIKDLLNKIKNQIPKSDYDKLFSDYEKFVKRFLRNEYKKDNNLLDCIFCIDSQNLDGLGEIPNIEFKHSDMLFRMKKTDVRQCRTCLRIWCIKCLVEFIPGLPDNQISHNNLNCEQYQELIKEKITDDDNVNLVVKRHIKCPGCFAPVEKTASCNHITCLCGIHFCYLCGKNITNQVSSHFDSGGCRTY